MSRDRPSVISAKRAGTRGRLIEAAAQCIGEKGFHLSTLDEIAARAGLTKGAIYDNFESKDELFVAVLALWPNRIQTLRWPDSRKGSLKERFRQLGLAVAALSATAREEAPLRAELLLYTLTHEGMRRRIASLGAERFKQLEEHLLRFASEDELAIRPPLFAILLESLISGLLYLRAQAPEFISDGDVVSIFEALAGKGTRGSIRKHVPAAAATTKRKRRLKLQAII